MSCLRPMFLILLCSSFVAADDVKTTDLYKRIRAAIDSVSAIDTHDHLRPFDQIVERHQTELGRGMSLYSIWRGSYYPWINPLTVNAEGIYAATVFTRQCLSEALAEKVVRRELREEHAIRIGGQVMRDNALKMFPALQRYLWKNK